MPHRILEIGPGDQPRHDVGGVELNDAEEYVALDVNPKEFEAPIWKQLGDRFGDKIRWVVSSRDAIPQELGIFNEVVMLGSQGNPKSDIVEIDRVLGNGGVLKLGVLTWGKNGLLKEWLPVLKARGYQMINERQCSYTATLNRDYDGTTSPASNSTPESYTVLTFMKM